jgi:Rod binding domain-containing protein
MLAPSSKEKPMLTTPPITPNPRPDSLRRSAEAFEASFLAEMLKNAGVFKPAEGFGGGPGEAHFTSFLADTQARAMVARGGIGLADSIERALRARMADTVPDSPGAGQ